VKVHYRFREDRKAACGQVPRDDWHLTKIVFSVTCKPCLNYVIRRKINGKAYDKTNSSLREITYMEN
jgi:hypothetical protein